MAEQKVVIAPDSVATGAHSIRTLTVQPVGPTTSDEQQVVTLADSQGNLYTIDNGGQLVTYDPSVNALLMGVLLRLDILNAALADSYDPPDDLTELEGGL